MVSSGLRTNPLTLEFPLIVPIHSDAWCGPERTYLRLLRELEGVDAVSEVGGERVVQLAQGLLQRLQRLLVLLQSLQLLLQTDLPVHRLRGVKTRDRTFTGVSIQSDLLPVPNPLTGVKG